MFIKKPKSRPSLRTRDSDDITPSPLSKSITTDNDPDSSINIIEDDGDGDISMGSIMERKKAQKKGKDKKRPGTGTTRLSFGGPADESSTGGGDGDGGDSPAFKPKKSLLSQSISARLPSTPSHSSPLASTSSTASPSYSSEYLSQLKASTPSRGPRQNTTSITVEDDEDERDASGLSRLAREKYAAVDTTEGIPDAAAIAAAKMKRAAAIESAKHDGGAAGGEEDYIALGGRLIVHDGEAGPHPESRLMREEDEEGEGDEDLAEYTEAQDKLYIGKKASKDAARRMKGEIGEMIADREAEDEDDEETKEWEMAQIRRAGKFEDEKPDVSAKKGYVPAPIPKVRPIPTVAAGQARIAKAIAELKALKSQNERNLETTLNDLASLEEQERDLRREVERVEGKREWTEEFRGWVEMLGKFLEEKFPKLEGIEADSYHNMKERSELVDKRRSEDDSDDLALFLGVAPPQEGGTEVDELGRSRQMDAGPSSGIRRARRAARDSRRTKRQKRKEVEPRVSAEDEGYSTDSTLAEGDAEDYAASLQNLDHRVHALLEDVRAEEFRDPNKGLAVKFDEWRKREEEEYVSAFGGLALVHAWEFWARGEMVGWEPLRSSSSLEHFTWFTSIHKYCHPKPPALNNSAKNGNFNGDEDDDVDDMDMDEEPPLGPEGDLIPEMISRAVVPLLIKAFDNGAYDPYSVAQTRRAVDLADVVSELMGKDSRKFTSLLKSILMVIHNHLTSLSTSIQAASFPPALPPPAFDPNSRIALNRYINRRIKLARSILLWKRQSPVEVGQLINRLVGQVIRPVLERCWDSGGKEAAEKVLQVTGNILSADLSTFLRQGPVQGRY